MKGQEPYADRFSAEVDRLLERQGRAEDAGPPSEYAEMLALAETLATLDFSQGSSVRRRLRRRLLNRSAADRPAAGQRLATHGRLLLLVPRRALGAVVALLALAVLVGLSPPGRAVAQAVGQFIHEMRWLHTTVQQVSPSERATATPDASERLEEELAQGRAWEVKFERYVFSGCCYGQPVRDEVVPLSQAVDEAGFELLQPYYLPEGFQLTEGRLLGAPPYDVFLVYDGDHGRLVLYQSPVGVTSQQHRQGDAVVVEKRKMDVLTDRVVEEVMVGGIKAALTDSESLTWEKNDVSFRLIGPGLDKVTLLRIAESLAPIR
jgi:hypothetical protein